MSRRTRSRAVPETTPRPIPEPQGAPAGAEAAHVEAPDLPASASDLAERAIGDVVLPPKITPEEGMRYYAAILGHEPTLDPEAPDIFEDRREENAGAMRAWADGVTRTVREEITRRLHIHLKRRPTWREVMDAMTVSAARRVEEARRRLQRRDAA